MGIAFWYIKKIRKFGVPRIQKFNIQEFEIFPFIIKRQHFGVIEFLNPKTWHSKVGGNFSTLENIENL